MIASRNAVVNIAALVMLTVMGVLMFTSIKDEAIIIDEDPHIGAGYSYLVKGDFRLNPEHPPLMKDLGALPLLGMGLFKPWDHKSWTEDVNGQWEFGRALIFGGGNNADAITQAVKIPMIVFTLLFGLLFYVWTKKTFGGWVALLATFFYAFSPTFLAHGRFVTTDVGASAGFFVAMIAFLWFLKKPDGGRMWIAGLALGFALLTKFSTFMLLPIFAVLALLWVIAHRSPAQDAQAKKEDAAHTHLPFSARGKDHADEHFAPEEQARPVHFWPMVARCIGVIIVAILAVWPLYWHHTRNYPSERQRGDTTTILATYRTRIAQRIADQMQKRHILPQYENAVRLFPQNIVIWGSDKPIIKGLAQYFLGLLMVTQRTTGGNTAYFLGEVTKFGSSAYFPVVYALKEPLTMHMLSLVAFVFLLFRLPHTVRKRKFLKNNFVYITFFAVIAFYWWLSVSSILNIGVRHVMPTFPFIYILMSVGLVKLGAHLKNAQTPSLEKRVWGQALFIPFTAVIAAAMVWQALSVTRIHPFYLAYFNELAGGPEGGYRYVVDSNLDWGQDLKRLANFVKEWDIEKIHFDYFGWADPFYYLGEKRVWMTSCDEPRSGWIAVSASFYQGSREKPECDYRRWLPMEKLVTAIGHSIFVFYVD